MSNKTRATKFELVSLLYTVVQFEFYGQKKKEAYILHYPCGKVS